MLINSMLIKSILFSIPSQFSFIAVRGWNQRMDKTATICFEEDEEVNGGQGSGQGSTPSNTSRQEPAGGADSESEEQSVREGVGHEDRRLNNTDVLVPTHSYVDVVP
jgi:hypothetical protein